MSTLRVAVVDDSDIAARRVEQILEAEPDVRVVRRFSSADDLLGWQDLDTMSVVVLDVWMPGTSGLSAIREIAARVPVVIVSETAEDSDLANEALAQGASAFVPKRLLGDASGEERLRAAVRAAVAAHGGRDLRVLIVLGSTGAPRALERLIPELRGTPAAIVIVQHLPAGGEVAFARWITSMGVPAVPARHGDALRAGRAIVAPAGRHLVFEGGAVRLVCGAPGDLHVPSCDRALRSATSLGRRVTALVLSGMGRDAAAGVAELLANGGSCLAQRPDDCAAPSMPQAALATSPRVRALPLDALGRDVREILRRRH